MKALKLIAAAAALFGSSLAFAVTSVSSPFTVSVSLTPVCNVKTAATNINFGTYTPFTDPGKSGASYQSTVTFRCSRGITPTSVGLATTSTDVTVSAAAASGSNATAVGVLTGLRYTLSVSDIAASVSVAGVDATAGAAGVGGVDSTAKEYLFTVQGAMAGGQAGGNTGANESTHNYTIVLSY